MQPPAELPAAPDAALAAAAAASAAAAAAAAEDAAADMQRKRPREPPPLRRARSFHAADAMAGMSSEDELEGNLPTEASDRFRSPARRPVPLSAFSSSHRRGAKLMTRSHSVPLPEFNPIGDFEQDLSVERTKKHCPFRVSGSEEFLGDITGAMRQLGRFELPPRSAGPEAVSAPISLIPSLLSGLVPGKSLDGGLSHYNTPTRTELDARSRAEIQVSTESLIEAMLKSKIRLVVVDLDMTLLNIHTKGRFPWLASVLASQHIRPVFHVLIPQLLKAGIPVGVATLSSQDALIRDMLVQAFPGCARLDDNVFVRCSREGEVIRSASVDPEPLSCYFDREETTGKRVHIRDILNRMASGKDIAPGEILFIDDDASNVECARIDGHRVVRFLNEISDQDFLKACYATLPNV